MLNSLIDILQASCYIKNTVAAGEFSKAADEIRKVV